MKIYLAGPLFCEGEKIINQKITDLLESFGYSVFLPQRDGVLAAEFSGKSEAEIYDIVFKKDYSHLKECDALLFVLDGRVPDEGGCVELGIAYALGKRCYGVRSDARALEQNISVNPMIMGCFTRIFEDTDFEKLMAQLTEYLKTNEL